VSPAPDRVVLQEFEERFQVAAKQFGFRFHGGCGHVAAIDSRVQPMLDDFLLGTVERHQVLPQIGILLGEREVQPGLKGFLMTLAERPDAFFSSESGGQAMMPVSS
jgi:hypothetical protein